MIPQPLLVTVEVAEALERLGVPHFVGGSLASSAHGIARATLDADMVADREPKHAETLTRELGPGLYADIEAIREAIQGRSSFNLIHIATAFKVDVFVPAASR